MKKLLLFIVIVSALVFGSAYVKAEDEVVDDVIIEENGEVVEEGDEEALTENLLVILRESYPEIISMLSLLAIGLATATLRGFLTSNKKFNIRTSSLMDNAGTIVKTGKEVHEAYELIKSLKIENDFIRRKVEKVEEGEKFVMEALKDLAKGSSIAIDEKIKVASTYDNFVKFMTDNGIKETEQYVDLKSAVEEIKDSFNLTKTEDIKKVDSYIENLKAMSKSETKH